MPRIHIDHLQLRLKGMTLLAAQAGVAELKAAILQQLAEQAETVARTQSPRRIPLLNLGSRALSRSEQSWPATAARQITRAILMPLRPQRRQ